MNKTQYLKLNKLDSNDLINIESFNMNTNILEQKIKDMSIAIEDNKLKIEQKINEQDKNRPNIIVSTEVPKSPSQNDIWIDINCD